MQLILEYPSTPSSFTQLISQSIIYGSYHGNRAILMDRLIYHEVGSEMLYWGKKMLKL